MLDGAARATPFGYAGGVRLTAALALSAFACAATPSTRPARVDVLVLAPHPDDEVLMAGGALAAAVARGAQVAVVVVTNGDLSCARDGRQRQAETVTALASLGVHEAQVRFLGYPDGHLSRLGDAPLAPLERIGPDGACARADVTWATRGLGGVDERTRRTGRPAPYTAAALTEDLAAVLEALEPGDVYLPHGIDMHPDHAMTYVFFRRALDRLARAPLRAHRSVVHASDPCWPSDCRAPLSPTTPTPPLPGALGGYHPTERVPVDAARKLAAITTYRSQLEGPVESDWLAGFARTDEAFFVERYRRDGGPWVAVPDGAEAPECRREGARVECSARLQGDLDEVSTWDEAGFRAVAVRPRG
ncbi:MAG: PIG-L family deacetylase [Myxococcaceae bacterium]|jgi:LmbE family N-acetylglucosaminyl deacetylase|nr:PIG-L family deacetylase [Myxococcaceae bacterium]MCA3016636.1 PIG-L family deacetylase [Myxococcaceae bacterium]